jgi:hypothetical protein
MAQMLWQQAPLASDETPAWMKAPLAGLESAQSSAPAVTESEAAAPTMEWGGRQVDKADIERVAHEQGVVPESIARLGTWQGRLESRLAKSAVGQSLLRAEQGLSDLGATAISLGSRAGILPQSMGDHVRREQKQREDYLSFIERGSDLESLMGDRGSRIYSGLARSMPKLAASGLSGGAAVLSTIGAEAYDTGLEEAKQNHLEGVSAHAYAGSKALIETGVTFLMGSLGKSLGLTTMEEALSPAMRNAAANVAQKAGLTGKVASFMANHPKLAGAAGSQMEAAEEMLIDGLHQMNESAESGGSFNLGRQLESYLGGVMGGTLAHRAVGLADGLNKKLQMDRLGETIKGVKGAEDFLTTRPQADIDILAPGMTRREFEAATGIKKTSSIFRDEFLNAVDFYRNKQNAPAGDTTALDDFQGEDGYQPIEPPQAAEIASDSPAEVMKDTQASEPTGNEAQPDENEAIFAAKKAFLKEYGAELGIDAGNPASPSERRTAIAFQAQQEGYAQRGVQIAEDVLNKRRYATRIEVAGMTLRGAEIKAERAALKSAMETQTDPVLKAASLKQYDDLQREAETLVKALDFGGSEAGRDLNFRKFAVPEDWDEATNVVRAEATKAAPLTQEERAKFRDLSDKQEGAATKAAAVDNKFNEVKRQARNREVSRVRGAVNSIRKQLGLDKASNSSTDVPALSDNDRAQLADIDARLQETLAYLDGQETILPTTDFIHNRPSEIQVSNLDDAIAATKRTLAQKTVTPSWKIEQREIARVEAKIAHLNDIIAGKQPLPTASTMDAMSKKRSELTDDLNQLRSKATEVRKTQAVLKRLDAAQKELADAYAGNVKEREKLNDVMSQERAEAHYELQSTRRKIKEAIGELSPDWLQRGLGEGDNLLRASMTSYDLGGLGRQAKPVVLAHPTMVKPAMQGALKAWSDPKQAFLENMRIKERPYAALYAKGELAIEALDGDISQRSENMLSNLIQRESNLPPLELYRKGILGSQRAHVTLLNRIRADLFDMMVDNLGGPSNLSPKDLKEVGHFVNVATGRGGSAMLEQHMGTASHLFFSPRFMLSRIQYLTGQPMWQTSPKVRKAIAKEYVRSLAGSMLWYSILSATYGGEEGFGISLDSSSADFLKVRIGSTTIDPAAGAAQWMRFASAINPWSKRDPRDRQQAVDRFVKGKLAPSVGLAYNIATGANTVGDPMNFTTGEGALNIAEAVAVPLQAQEVVPIFKQHDLPVATMLLLHNALGEGVQNYPKPGTKQQALPSTFGGKRGGGMWD